MGRMTHEVSTLAWLWLSGQLGKFQRRLKKKKKKRNSGEKELESAIPKQGHTMPVGDLPSVTLNMPRFFGAETNKS